MKEEIFEEWENKPVKPRKKKTYTVQVSFKIKTVDIDSIEDSLSDSLPDMACLFNDANEGNAEIVDWTIEDLD